MAQVSGSQVLTAAAIVGVAVIGGSLVLAQSLNRVTQQVDRASGRLDEIRVAVVDAKDAIGNLQLAAPGQAAQRGPDPNKRYPATVNDAPVIGPETAAVTIIEFSDFQCPFCKRVGPTLRKIEEEYGDQVRIAFKHQPLSIHPKAPAAHAAAEAAHRQGKFWEMHDLIFENQKEMSPEKYLEYAAQLGLDVERFKIDVESDEVKARIDADKLEAAKLAASGTPTFYINGLLLSGAKPFEAFKVVIDKELAAKKKT
jgi:protein-disulfide isomerase